MPNQIVTLSQDQLDFGNIPALSVNRRYVCMYVCVNVRMYICMCVCMCVCMYGVSGLLCTRMYVCMCFLVFLYVSTNVGVLYCTYV